MAARRPRTKWRPEDDKTLVLELLDCKTNALQADSGWKSTAWTRCAEALADSELVSGGPAKSADSCQTRWGKLKGEFILVKKMRNQSGFGWNDATKTPTATKEVWEPFLVLNPKAKDLLDKPFPLYDEISILVDGAVATGNFVFRSGKSGRSGAKPASEAPAATPDMDTSTAASEMAQASGSPSTPSADHRSSSEPLEEPGGDSLETVHTAVQTPRTPQRPASRKRPTSPSSESISPLSVQHKKGRVSGADALLSMSRAIHSMSDALATPAHGITTPQRRAKAIAIVEQEEDMSDTEVVQVAKMFRVQPDVADTYVALQSKSIRSDYVRSELEDFLARSQ